ncbi:MAG: hypothetical protein IPP77_00315 [Bacteroidetes bacterium]|nr:hypothetical protein [Bacteroidota bacterium]
MKQIIAVTLLFISVFSSQAQEKRYKIVCIGFYNLENFYDTINDPEKNDEDFLPNGANGYTGAVYKDKLSKLSEVVSQIGKEQSPDGLALLGVAEVENKKVMEDLIAQPSLANRHYQIVHYNSPDYRGIDVGLFYNPKYFKVLHSEPLFVHLAGSGGSVYYTRDVLWVSGLLDGEIVHVFVNHWPSRRGGEDASAPNRAAAATVCKKVIDSLMRADANTKVILMGDLNDDPVSESVTKVIGAKGEAKKVREGGMFNPWVEKYSKGIGTLAYNDSWNLFDQIMLSYGFLNKEQPGLFFKSAQIFKKSFMVVDSGKYKGYPLRTYEGVKYAGGYSDHFPTYCIFLKEVPNP